VDLVGPQGGVWAVESTDISRGGLQVRCSRETGLALVRECGRTAPNVADRYLGVRLGLDAAAGAPKRLAAQARIVYARPGPDAYHIVGLEFVTFEGDSYEQLQQYIVECLRY
jgi:hypothetical protein